MLDIESIYSIVSLEDNQDIDSEEEESEFIEEITNQIDNFTSYLSELVENDCNHNWIHRQV